MIDHYFVACADAAEALALLKGCEFGMALGLRMVIVEFDSYESISSFSNSLENGRWEAYPTLMKVKRLGNLSRTVIDLGFQDQTTWRQTRWRRREVRRCVMLPGSTDPHLC